MTMNEVDLAAVTYERLANELGPIQTENYSVERKWYDSERNIVEEKTTAWYDSGEISPYWIYNLLRDHE